MKEKVDYKASELHVFCEKLEELVNMQTRNIERAFTLNSGPYRVSPLYSDMQQKPNTWIRLSTPSKERFIKKLSQKVA